MPEPEVMHEYEILIGGLPHTVLLDADTAQARGLTPAHRVAAKAAPAPANKEREPEATKARRVT